MKEYIVANLVGTNSGDKFPYALDLDPEANILQLIMKSVLMKDSVEKLVKNITDVDPLVDKQELFTLRLLNKVINCDDIDVDEVIATNAIKSLDPADIIAVAITEKGSMVIYPPALGRHWDDIVKNTIYIYGDD